MKPPFKELAVLAALVSGTTVTQANSSFIVMGDSYSAVPESWVRQLDQSSQYIHTQVNAISGRAIQNFTLSADLVPHDNMDTVILWMGAGDAILLAPDTIVATTQELVDDLVGRGFRVIYALPPVIQNHNWDTTLLREAVSVGLHGAEIVDPPIVDRLEDKVHPTTAGHRTLAVWWMWTLYAMGV